MQGTSSKSYYPGRKERTLGFPWQRSTCLTKGNTLHRAEAQRRRDVLSKLRINAQSSEVGKANPDFVRTIVRKIG